MDRGYREAMSINYVKGDATAPIGSGTKIVVHICNDAGKWGKGFVLAVSKRWPKAEREYRTAFAQAPKPSLGDVQIVEVADDMYVANLIGQHGVARSKTGVPPIRYPAVRQGLERVAMFAQQHGATVHMPRIGCGLAGGTWDQIGPIVEEALCGVSVTVYDWG